MSTHVRALPTPRPRPRRPAGTIASLHARAEAIRRAEVDRVRWDGLSHDDRLRIERLTRSLVEAILHEPTTRAAAGADDDHLDSLRHLFGLEGPGGRCRHGAAPCRERGPAGSEPAGRVGTTRP